MSLLLVFFGGAVYYLLHIYVTWHLPFQLGFHGHLSDFTALHQRNRLERFSTRQRSLRDVITSQACLTEEVQGAPLHLWKLSLLTSRVPRTATPGPGW